MEGQQKATGNAVYKHQCQFEVKYTNLSKTIFMPLAQVFFVYLKLLTSITNDCILVFQAYAVINNWVPISFPSL